MTADRKLCIECSLKNIRFPSLEKSKKKTQVVELSGLELTISNVQKV